MGIKSDQKEEPMVPEECRKLTIIMEVKNGRVPDMPACEVTTKLGKRGRAKLVRAVYMLEIELSDILGVEVGADFEPSDEQSMRLEAFVSRLFARVAKKIRTKVAVLYDTSICCAEIKIDGKKAKGLTKRLITDSIA